jgi:hypothetical protein
MNGAASNTSQLLAQLLESNVSKKNPLPRLLQALEGVESALKQQHSQADKTLSSHTQYLTEDIHVHTTNL